MVQNDSFHSNDVHTNLFFWTKKNVIWLLFYESKRQNETTNSASIWSVNGRNFVAPVRVRSHVRTTGWRFFRFWEIKSLCRDIFELFLKTALCSAVFPITILNVICWFDVIIHVVPNKSSKYQKSSLVLSKKRLVCLLLTHSQPFIAQCEHL